LGAEQVPEPPRHLDLDRLAVLVERHGAFDAAMAHVDEIDEVADREGVDVGVSYHW
jgi:hypothetical protein